MTYKSIHETLKKAFILYIPLSFLTPLLMYQWRDNNRLIVMDQAHSYHVTEYRGGVASPALQISGQTGRFRLSDEESRRV